MFILLEKGRLGWIQLPDTEMYETEDEAREAADRIGCVNVVIFEFKGFV